MFEIEEHKLYAIAVNWNKILSHLYLMIKKEEVDNDDDEYRLHYIVKHVW
jgi:hypothetical protein